VLMTRMGAKRSKSDSARSSSHAAAIGPCAWRNAGETGHVARLFGFRRRITNVREQLRARTCWNETFHCGKSRRYRRWPRCVWKVWQLRATTEESRALRFRRPHRSVTSGYSRFPTNLAGESEAVCVIGSLRLFFTRTVKTVPHAPS
jgi:hypothetical protein